MELEEIIDVLNDVNNWIKRQTQPDTFRVFNRCPICSTIWFPDGQFNIERHRNGCFVPGLQRAIEEAGNV
jgi:hypothetical protein